MNNKGHNQCKTGYLFIHMPDSWELGKTYQVCSMASVARQNLIAFAGWPDGQEIQQATDFTDLHGLAGLQTCLLALLRAILNSQASLYS